MTSKAKLGRKSKTARSDQFTFSQSARESHTNHDNHGGFPIVSIGAPAGGLEALELFLANEPLTAAWCSPLINTSTQPTKVSRLNCSSAVSAMQFFSSQGSNARQGKR